MSIEARISTITFKDSTTVNLDKGSILALVGPNNCGKTRTLSEIAHAIRRDDHRHQLIVSSVRLHLQGNGPDVESWFEQNAHKPGIHGKDPTYKWMSAHTTLSNAIGVFAKAENLDNITAFFLDHATTNDRLQLIGNAQSFDVSTQHPENPLQVLHKFKERENQICKIVRQAFSLDIAVRSAGQSISLRCGTKPDPALYGGYGTNEYLDELNKMPQLLEQGDGIKSFVGCLLKVFASSGTILVIDEPEAFLHPPQARLLGQLISRDLPKDKQLIAATHSGDFLKGLLDGNSKRLIAARMTREDSINRVCVLDNAEIGGLWSDSILRFSNALDGLFHSSAIVCESDSDCRFYNSVIDSLVQESGGNNPDISFISAGTKGRVKIVAKALSRLVAKVVCVLDFDVLLTPEELKGIVEALGSSWEKFSGPIESLMKHLSEHGDLRTIRTVANEITTAFQDSLDTMFDSSAKNRIHQITRLKSKRSEIKALGLSYFKDSEKETLNILLSDLKEIGVMVVPNGELESFCPSVSSHGQRWVIEILERNLMTDPELANARDFCSKLLKRCS